MVHDSGPAAELARRLARDAEAVCRHYLSNGRRQGRYWTVGDTANNPGRSLFVRLSGPDSGKGAAGKWTDAATGEHGDLLDLIREARGLASFRDVADEARAFLNLPRPVFSTPETHGHPSSWRHKPFTTEDRIAAAQKLFAMSQSIEGTAAETYLRRRAITGLSGTTALRFHPACYYRDEAGVTHPLPALLAAVTDPAGHINGVHRTWLASDGAGKAQVTTPRRAMGVLLGNGVRFGFADRQPDIIAAGEGIETMLSLRMAMPTMPTIAALSAAHLGALCLSADLQRLYIAGDSDGAGRDGIGRLGARARDAGIETLALRPGFGDFNDDLRRDGPDSLRLRLLGQLAPVDAARFLV